MEFEYHMLMESSIVLMGGSNDSLVEEELHLLLSFLLSYWSCEAFLCTGQTVLGELTQGQLSRM